MKEPLKLGIVGAGSVAVRGILPHAQIADFKDCVLSQAVCDPAPGRAEAEGKESIVTAEHARHVIDIIESAYRAAATGNTQELSTDFAWSEKELSFVQNQGDNLWQK